MHTSSRKEQVLALLKSLESGQIAPSNAISTERYIQHNLGAGDGIEGFRVLLGLPPGTLKANIVRIFEDGDHVFAHTEYEFFGPKVGIDIFRFENDRIVEHWDNLQPTPSQPNPSGRTLLDGPTTAIDHHQTEANKAVARAFVEDVFVQGRLERARQYIDGERYLQHHPRIADGSTSLIAALQAAADAGTPLRYTRIHKLLGEGNFVLIVSEGGTAAQPVAFYDLFRIENGKLAEHWDTVEPVPPRAEWKNANGKF